MDRLPGRCVLVLLTLLVLCAGLLGNPQPARAQEGPVSITLSGWGWCVAYRELGDVVANLDGYRIPRDNATEIEDIYLAGTLSFNISDRSDSFPLELRGTRVRSLFFLKQVTGGESPLIAEFEGTWLAETDYVACQGRLAIPAPNHVAKPYFFVLRTEGAEIPERERGGWVGNLEFIIMKLTGAFDSVADRLSSGGALVKQALGDLLAQVAAVAKGLRSLGVPYFT